MAVHVLKLITGEEIFGEVVNGPNVTKVTKPFLLVLGQTKNEQGEIVNLNQVIPWAMNLKGDTVTLDNTHVLYNEEANNELVNVYKRASGGGRIQTPNPTEGLVLP